MLASLRARWRLRRLLGEWLRYREIVGAALVSGEPTPAQEAEFLALKARLASHLQYLTDALPPQPSAVRSKEMSEVARLLAGHASLGSRTNGEDVNRTSFETLWHEHFIFFNTLKALKLGASRRPAPRAAAAPSGTDRSWLRRSLRMRRPVGVALVIALLALTATFLADHFEVTPRDALASARGAVVAIKNRFFTPAPPETLAAGPPAPPTLALRAILVDRVGSSAKIRLGDEASGWLSEGDTFRGWTVVRIWPDSVEVRKDGRTRVLKSR